MDYIRIGIAISNGTNVSHNFLYNHSNFSGSLPNYLDNIHLFGREIKNIQIQTSSFY